MFMQKKPWYSFHKTISGIMLLLRLNFNFVFVGIAVVQANSISSLSQVDQEDIPMQWKLN